MARHISWWPQAGAAIFGAITLLAILTLEARVGRLVANTLLLSGATAFFSLSIGAPLAMIVARTDLPFRRIAVAVLAAGLFIPLYLQATAWQAGFGLQGWASAVFGGAPLLEGWRGAIWVHTWAAVPWVVCIVGVGLRLVELELEEETLLDASAGQVFLHVTLPRAAAPLALSGLWVALTTAGEMTVTDLFQVRTFAEEIYTQFALGEDADSRVWTSAPSTLLVGVLLIAALLVSRGLAGHHRFVSQRDPWTFRPRGWRWPLAAVAWLTLAIMIGLPVGSLLYKAGLVVEHVAKGGERGAEGWARSWSATKCGLNILESPRRFSRELMWSLSIASLAASAATVLAIPLAWLGRRGDRWALPVWLLSAVCLGLPGPLLGIGIIGLLNHPQPALAYLYDYTIAAPLLAQTVKAFPLVAVISWHALGAVPGDLLDAAALEGAGPLARLAKVAIPSCWPAIVIAWLVGFAVALGDLAASILVVPPGVTTLPIRVFGLIHYGVDEPVAGISLALIAGLLGIFLAMRGIGRLLRNRV